MTSTDILIIGGGIAGTSTAYHLSEFKRDVILLDRGNLASEASGVNAGLIGGLGWGRKPDLDNYLTMGSLELFKSLQLDLGYDMEFRLSGSLSAIHTEEQYNHITHRMHDLKSQGLVSELVTTREARALEPNTNSQLLGFMYSPKRGQAHPQKSTEAFAASAKNNGSQIFTHRKVVAIDYLNYGGYRVKTLKEDFNANHLVIAAGAWCAEIGKMLGLNIPILPVRGQMWASERVSPKIFHTLSSVESQLQWNTDSGINKTTPPYLTHKDNLRVTRHLYGRQTNGGEIIFGGDRQLVGYNKTPDQSGIWSNYRHASEVIPMLEQLNIRRTWAGLMPFALDGKPIIGNIPLRDNLYILSGLGSSGFARGPMSGKLLADYIHTKHKPEILSEAAPDRRVTEKV